MGSIIDNLIDIIVFEITDSNYLNFGHIKGLIKCAVVVLATVIKAGS